MTVSIFVAIPMFAFFFLLGIFYVTPTRNEEESKAVTDALLQQAKNLEERERLLIAKEEVAEAERLRCQQAEAKAKSVIEEARRRIEKAKKERHGTVERFKRKEKRLKAIILEQRGARDISNPNNGDHV